MSFHITELEFSEHAKLKIEERAISSLDVSTVLKTPSAVYIDVETGYFIANGRAPKPDHYLIVVYVAQKDKVRVITVFNEVRNSRKESS